MKRLATKTALKWEKPLDEVTRWLRATLAFACTKSHKSVHKRKGSSAVHIHVDDGAEQFTFM